jgi:hypothetical protein
MVSRQGTYLSIRLLIGSPTAGLQNCKKAPLKWPALQRTKQMNNRAKQANSRAPRHPKASATCANSSSLTTKVDRLNSHLISSILTLRKETGLPSHRQTISPKKARNRLGPNRLRMPKMVKIVQLGKLGNKIKNKK